MSQSPTVQFAALSSPPPPHPPSLSPPPPPPPAPYEHASYAYEPYAYEPHGHEPYGRESFGYQPHGYEPHGYEPHGYRPEVSGRPARVPGQRGGRAERRRAAARRRRRRGAGQGELLRKLLPQALVVAFLAGGTSAFVAYDKAVELEVDGQRRTLHTFAGDVTQLLEDEGVRLGGHDTVLPGRAAPLAHGDEVAVRYGRPLALTLDGHRRQVWATAETVGGALRELGVRAAGARISAPRSAPIPRSGRELEVWTERTLTFLVDSREQQVRTNAASVGEALDDAGIALRDQDTASVPLTSFPRDGQTITVMRIKGSEQSREERIPFHTVRRPDPDLQEGTEVVVAQGMTGLRKVTFELRTVNGVRQRPRETGSELIRAPRTQVIKVGTKKLPAAVRGAEGLNWQGLAQCESGGRPHAVDSTGTYGGLYQFDTHTWHSLGGSGRPQDAPAGEQTLRAKKLYVKRGASPWPVCGRKLSQ
ncbi:ubiquitin-like domain-containing protein [Streptomyces axinellae]|uniref:G5 domain-containing protein n=1 Tax=Streptomyces axinellae TaxID=552788 RepID=A0ABN3Q7Y7_9ACTN